MQRETEGQRFLTTSGKFDSSFVNGGSESMDEVTDRITLWLLKGSRKAQGI